MTKIKKDHLVRKQSGSPRPAKRRRIALALTGASGLPYAMRLGQMLIEADVEIWLLYSQAARNVARQEIDLTIPTQPEAAQRLFSERWKTKKDQLHVFANDDWNAPITSGSNPADAYVICPCTMGTLARVASGLADDLISRAADVMLKEKKLVILVPRETPLSGIHLRNMLCVTHAGAIILPPCPGFYFRPLSVEDLVDFVVARILDQLEISHSLLPRWGHT